MALILIHTVRAAPARRASKGFPRGTRKRLRSPLQAPNSPARASGQHTGQVSLSHFYAPPIVTVKSF